MNVVYIVNRLNSQILILVGVSQIPISVGLWLEITFPTVVEVTLIIFI